MATNGTWEEGISASFFPVSILPSALFQAASDTNPASKQCHLILTSPPFQAPPLPHPPPRPPRSNSLQTGRQVEANRLRFK